MEKNDTKKSKRSRNKSTLKSSHADCREQLWESRSHATNTSHDYERTTKKETNRPANKMRIG
jgi:hypothetical protein